MMINLDWQEIGYDSDNIEKIAHDGQKLCVEFKTGKGYYYEGVPYDIFVRIMNKEVISKSEGKPSYGATFNMLVLRNGYKGEQYK